ncbi:MULTISPECIES: putative quinol monooxygenase [Rhodococcus]|uniref:putative quinol monooxygenase n=1 Tax=Rhodococcus TaxID=1827 RepID=UPI001E43ED48|nr:MULTISPECIES: putative quinol monooxygenase [Rhodococcus]MCD2108851.1 antibiotic biosynthesis monooxygenase [Rhodococcus qingshengii]MCZ4527854.1 putative quinol monooxygenase [Rhodococcus erythropolis]MDI9901782.1 putative quinol monooxygenase [Rhodococcus sp. IEGM 1409]MDV6276489.1 putative quinol monooxygenase [Rhodococcus erythropolis]MDV8004688.1 putative quinol monooxygenase [Rhodococcus sp. IEGM 1318]
MIAVIADITVKDGSGEQFEAVVAELAEKVRTEEPGTVLYQLIRSKTDTNSYKFMELYQDGAAIKAHGTSEHFQAAGKAMAPFLAGAPQIEYFDAL